MNKIKSVAIFLVVILLCYGVYHQILSFQARKHMPDNRYEVLAREYEIVTERNRQLDEKICDLEHQADSLEENANNERKIIHKLLQSRNEKFKAIDHFNDSELASFFSRVKTDSSGHKN